ncbi:MAG TPA: BON domain-containing protein, partial [Longimicrobium sp.]|uniref:BON domain-containing protein n=1 Tax=Longimicrobium sp. TaxID=2029185 RepID=UPI002EDB63EB
MRLTRYGTGVAAALACAGCSVLGIGGGAPVETPAQVAQRASLDTAIVREVEARLAAEPSIGSGKVRPVVMGGEVQLHGAVQGFGALQCAQANAGLVPGVTLVVDFLVLQPGPARVTCLAPRV